MAAKTPKKNHHAGRRGAQPNTKPARNSGRGDRRQGNGSGGAPRVNAPKPPQNGLLIWGRHAVIAALQNSDRRIATLYASEDSAAELESGIAALASDRRAELPPITIIEKRRLDAIGDGDAKAVHQGMVVAAWPLDPPPLEDLLAEIGSGPTRLIMLDQLSDPRNVGAIMRSARAFGAHAIIATHRNAPEENGNLARAATGALEHVPLVRVVNLARAIEALQEADITVAGLAGDGPMDIGDLASMPRLAIVMGAEGPGLRRLTRDHCDHLVSIPIDPTADSLNVSNAAAIALYAAGTARA